MSEIQSELVEQAQKIKLVTGPGILSAATVIDDRYEIISHIGSGGMGEVYKVFDRSTQRNYALKMLFPEVAGQKLLAKRLENEARAARTLAHGNIVSVYDVGESADGAPYLVMDYIEGESLDAILKKEAVLTPARAIPIFIQIAEALVHARLKGVLHRDLKPSNILLTKTAGDVDVVKVIDFGIAKISDQQTADKTKLTQTGELVGTPLYMSPEQCRGEELDGRSDIYSFGCIMYEVLSGQAAYAAENQVLVILKHLGEDPPPLPVGAGISANLKAVINRCLEKDPRDRYDNAVDLQIDLERVQDGRALLPYKRRFKVTPGLRKTLVASVAALWICLAAGLFAAMMHPGAQPPAPVAAKHRPDSFKDKTLAQWTAAIERSPDDPSLYFDRGMLHEMRDERTNAIDDFTQAIALKPDFIQAYCERSTEYALIANYDRAAQDADKAIVLDPDSPSGYEARGWVFSAREQYAESSAAWERVIALNDSGYPHYQLAMNLLKLAQYDKAESEINTAIRLEPTYNISTFHGIAGIIAAFRQDFPKSLDQLTMATKTEDARGVEWQELAFYYVCVGQMPDAERAIQQAKTLETFPARAYRLAGELYRTAGMYEKAIQEFSASTSLEEYPPGYRERAMAYISLNQWRSAYEDLKKSSQLNPYSTTTMSYLALVEDRLGMKQQASQHIAVALKGKATPPIIYANQAAIELNNGNTQVALKAANQAISLDPWLKEGYQVRSQTYRQLNNQTAAQSDHAKAGKLVSHLDL